MSRFIAVNIVTNENEVMVYATSPHLTPTPLRLMELNKDPKHWKNKLMTTPRVVDQTDKVGTDMWMKADAP